MVQNKFWMGKHRMKERKKEKKKKKKKKKNKSNFTPKSWGTFHLLKIRGGGGTRPTPPWLTPMICGNTQESLVLSVNTIDGEIKKVKS